MDLESDDLVSNSKYLSNQLITARKEIHNLRQQIKNLKYIHEKDVNNIKKLLELCTRTPTQLCNPTDDITLRNSEPFPNTAFTENNYEPSTSNNSNMCNLNINPIGIVSSCFPNKRCTPRQPTICNSMLGKLTLFKTTFTNPEHALQGLEDFSHMWILFYFHRNDSNHIRAKISPPRLNGLKTGVFSTRSPHRPSPIGLSLVKINRIEGCVVHFEGVDMVDQTPVLDIKPYIPQYDNPSCISQLSPSSNTLDELTGNATLLNDLSRSEVLENVTENRLRGISPPTSFSLQDVSRDEEIAMRLQAEEFQGNANFQNNFIDNENTAIAMEENELQNVVNNIDNHTGNEIVRPENNTLLARNSRFLDGADGPSPVCRGDIISLNRNTSNLRISDDSSTSNSPVRMGIRGAPDGEEGFDSLQSSTRISNVNNIQLNISVPQSSNQNVDNPEDEIRIPEWIRRPKTLTLSVRFNERSLFQLQEICAAEAEEKKHSIENILKEDPRSVYLRQRYGNQFYTFLILDLHITCRFDDERKIVTVFQIRNAGRTCECGQPDWQCTGHSPHPTNSE